MLTTVLLFIFAFAVVATLIWSGIQVFQDQSDPLGDRLEELRSSNLVVNAQVSRRKGGGGFWGQFLYILSLAGMEGWLHENEKELLQAGVRNKHAVAYYAMFVIVFTLLLAAGGIYLQRDKDIGQLLIGLLPVFLLGYLLPRQILHRLVKRYRAKLQDALPDTVDLLGIVLGTGLAIDQAMTRVSEEMQHIYPELANEFYMVTMQVRAGQERGKAFNNLVRRTGLEDVKSLAAMIIQSEKFGTSLSTALKVYADALRTRRRLRAEAAVGKAGIKMLFPIVVFILPVLFVITLVPGMLSVLKDLETLRGGK